MTDRDIQRQLLTQRLDSARFHLKWHAEAEMIARRCKSEALQEVLELRRQLHQLDADQHMPIQVSA